ncbi:MAG: RNA methyltransferase, TrmH family [candidate division WWE3 bacterium GW2011_GWC1_41_7]|uniref:RNA methyltransferase, TrmH family n=2 Tax=Katanobacteria TaxID=422282 RepID=A0A0G0X7J3_UNCKA|nr:MAG: RNA methyltransferase, TrmH family [candidate division WWE3 bacterium GW2011_GWB1_41_6]KKS21044.1 MAG: RNA methyltransferase, TrmH family [candidate division WWE3 bacterium GW2011_GWC1_41_7]
MKLKKYDKKYDFSYTFGVSPTIELLLKKPEIVRLVLIHSDGEKSDGGRALKELCRKHSIKFEIASKAIDRISAKENTYAIGVFKKYRTSVVPNANHVLLMNPSNPGNLGTIIRSMVGFDFNDLAVIRPAVDAFDPKVVRASMGSVFDLKFEYFDSFDQYVKRFTGHNLYPFVLHGKNKLKDITFNKPFTLIFGKESSGLSSNFSNIGTSVYIPHSKNIDSLNLHVAASIGMYESLK